MQNSIVFVRFLEVVRFWEGPLREVPLYPLGLGPACIIMWVLWVLQVFHFDVHCKLGIT